MEAVLRSSSPADVTSTELRVCLPDVPAAVPWGGTGRWSIPPSIQPSFQPSSRRGGTVTLSYHRPGCQQPACLRATPPLVLPQDFNISRCRRSSCVKVRATLSACAPLVLVLVLVLIFIGSRAEPSRAEPNQAEHGRAASHAHFPAGPPRRGRGEQRDVERCGSGGGGGGLPWPEQLQLAQEAFPRARPQVRARQEAV